jgi:predicted GNAT family N-acyltransferase
MGILLLTDIGTNNSVFQDAYHIRLKVFSEEQGIPQNNELDEFDNTAYHCVIYLDEIPIACGRMNIINDGAKICRIAVMKDSRRSGYATELCKHFISIAQQNGAKYVYLHAQTYITDLYRKIGFVSEGENFIEEGIPHVRMTKKLYTPLTV